MLYFLQYFLKYFWDSAILSKYYNNFWNTFILCNTFAIFGKFCNKYCNTLRFYKTYWNTLIFCNTKVLQCCAILLQCSTIGTIPAPPLLLSLLHEHHHIITTTSTFHNFKFIPSRKDRTNITYSILLCLSLIFLWFCIILNWLLYTSHPISHICVIRG